MFGGTLSFYFGRHFAKMVLAIFLLSALLITIISYLEYFSRAFRHDSRIGLELALVSILRVPSVTEAALPFVVLYGSIAAFVIANRRLELVVSRAAGVSAWQFLLPACVVGLVFGILATTAYNPLSAAMFARGKDMMAQAFMSRDEPRPVETGSETGPIWVRQAGGGGESIIGSTESFDEGLGLVEVTAYVFGPGGRFIERVDAPTGHYFPGEWRLDDATVTPANAEPRQVPVYALPTDLSPTEVRRSFLNVESVSFWSLPRLVESARRAGLPPDRYVLQYHKLLSRPVLLLAMVLIAASVSLRFSRSRELGRMIVTGVFAGFMLYVVMRIAWDLGSGGIVPPPLAAWLPAIIATLVGITVLLHLEDG